ncbi:hypothetical protein [Duganella sp.]|uniref:hypothetical protein n=1 Tax=Duganella sp. TaxID=1904440 RepID=UPI0031D39E49
MFPSKGPGHGRMQPLAASATGTSEANELRGCLDASNGDCAAFDTPRSELTVQIEAAFLKLPTVARILHGARRIHQGGRGRRTALFPSRKCGGIVPLESQLELAYAVVLERSPWVNAYRTQAIRITLPGGRFAHPDFLIRTMAGTYEVHEVKPSTENLSADDIERFNTMRVMLAEVSVGFGVIDARHLPGTHTLNDLLRRYSRGHLQRYTANEIDHARSILISSGTTTLHQAYLLLQRNRLSAHLADYLHFHQLWSADLDPDMQSLQGAA